MVPDKAVVSDYLAIIDETTLHKIILKMIHIPKIVYLIISTIGILFCVYLLTIFEQGYIQTILFILIFIFVFIIRDKIGSGVI